MKKLQKILMIVLCVCLMAGCKSAIPEMDAETQELVVEYAAATVRKYNEYQPKKLLDVQEEAVDETVEETTEESAAEPVGTSEVSQEAASEVLVEDESTLIPDGSVEVIEKGEQQLVATSLEGYYGLTDMTLAYNGYEVKDSYPDNGDDIYFIMDATDGMKLLVLKFQLENNAPNEQMVDFINKGIRYKIEVNGESKNALTTMLLNDLANYQGNIAASATEELVLVCEIPRVQSDAITSLSLVVKNADETATISLN